MVTDEAEEKWYLLVDFLDNVYFKFESIIKLRIITLESRRQNLFCDQSIGDSFAIFIIA